MTKYVCEHCGGPLRVVAHTPTKKWWGCVNAHRQYQADLLHARQNLGERFGVHLDWVEDPQPAQQRMEAS